MKEYVVGIDFGHGETSAWVVPINPDINTQIEETGKDLKLNPATDFNPQWSLIYYRIDESGCKRDASLKNGPQKVTASGFKGKPSTLFGDDGLTEQGWAYQEFIRLIFERMMERNGDTLRRYEDGNYNFDLCIACPTKWSADEQRGYLEFFNDALRPKGISVSFIMNESDAAFFSQFSRDNMDMNVLVIDYGSSTIDYTLIGRGRKLSDDSWSNSQLGASQMERDIINYLMEAPDFDEKLERTLLACQSTGNSHYTKAKILDFFTLEARSAKELSFKETRYPNLRQILFSMAEQCGDYYADVPPFDNTSFFIRGNLEVISQMYREAIKQEFTILKNRVGEVLQGGQPDKIILSGGACVMDWVYETVEEVFGSDVIITRDSHPGWVVSKGVALYGVTRQKALEKLERNIEREDYASLFKRVDKEARESALKKLFPNLVDSITRTPNMTGNSIFNRFSTFIRNLHEDSTYLDLQQTELDKGYSQNIGVIVFKVIKDEFGIEINKEEVFVHVYAEPYQINFKDETIKMMIDNASGRWSFTWDLPRDENERKKIATGTSKAIIEWLRTIPYHKEDLKDTGRRIREKAFTAAIDVFNKNQLFRETFVKDILNVKDKQ